MRNAIFSAAYLLSGAILLAASTISNGGYFDLLGIFFLVIGILLSVWEPLKKWVRGIRQNADPS